MFDIKNIIQAKTSDQAIAALLTHSQARLIAGGTDLLVKLRAGKLENCRLVSIHDAEDLQGVSLTEDGAVAIGPLCTFRELCQDPLIQAHLPLLAQGAATVGGPQIRAMGTVGGNLCNGATSADTAPALLAYGAKLQLKGPGGLETLDIADFYLGPGQVKLGHNQILYRILVEKADYQDYQGAYLKYAMRNAMDIANTGCSANVRLSPDKKTFERVRVAFGVAGPVPMRAPAAEAAITGSPLTKAAVERFGNTVIEDINPRDSWRASKAFRQHIAVELAQRCLVESVKRCGGAII